MAYNECFNCKFAQRTNTYGKYFDLKCIKNGSSNHIATCIAETDCIPKPLWCDEPTSQVKTFMDLTPNIPWSEIKPGDEFHVPPCNTTKRYDIKVVNVNSSWFSYHKNDSDVLDFMYPTYTAYKVMVRHKGWKKKYD